MVTGMRFDHDCEERWLSASLAACLPSGGRSEYIRVFVEGDAELNQGNLRRLGIPAAWRVGTGYGGADVWDGPLPDVGPWGGGYYLIDADGRIHDHTAPLVHTPLDEEQVIASATSAEGRADLIVRANPRSGAISEIVFDNDRDDIGYFLFELRYRNDTYSNLFAVQVAPNTVATMDRSTMAKLGIRNAVGVGDALVESLRTHISGITTYDSDGRLTALQSRHHTIGCPPNVT